MRKIDPASFNAGVATMIAIARRSAEALNADPRHIPIGFAVAALDQLATDGAVLLLPIGKPDASTSVEASSEATRQPAGSR